MNRLSDKDKMIEVQSELIKNLQTQIKEWDEQVIFLTNEARSLKTQVDMLKAQNDQWQAGSQERYAKGRTVDEFQTVRASTGHDKMRKKGKFKSRDKRWKEAIKEESKIKSDNAVKNNTLSFKMTRKPKK